MMDELHTARTLLAQTCGVLKVFPLPGVVVLPGTPAPFHVFESRYRAMTADALAGDRLLAVATLAFAFLDPFFFIGYLISIAVFGL